MSSGTEIPGTGTLRAIYECINQMIVMNIIGTPHVIYKKIIRAIHCRQIL